MSTRLRSSARACVLRAASVGEHGGPPCNQSSAKSPRIRASSISASRVWKPRRR
jgi:hypothetical protein